MIGILALQGAVDAHGAVLSRLGADWQPIYKPEALSDIQGLIIPGGESTTLLNLMQYHAMDKAIIDFATRGAAILGTCAGMILLANSVTGPAQPSLGLMDIDVARNAYGRQQDSFTTLCDDFEAVFIRAPKIIRHGPNVTVLAKHNDAPVLVQQEKLFAASFHPELTQDTKVHEIFLKQVA